MIINTLNNVIFPKELHTFRSKIWLTAKCGTERNSQCRNCGTEITYLRYKNCLIAEQKLLKYGRNLTKVLNCSTEMLKCVTKTAQ